jgi:hypothetical protein
VVDGIEIRRTEEMSPDDPVEPGVQVASPPPFQGRVFASVLRLAAWLESFGPLSQDQYDFWASDSGRRAKSLYYAGAHSGKLAVAPFVLLDTLVPSSRRLFRRPARFPIADAHWAMGFYLLAAATGDRNWRTRGDAFLASLLAERCPGTDEYCWGYPFDWETCFGTFKAGTPLITTIPYVYDALEIGHQAGGTPGYLDVMESIGRFAFAGLPDTETGPGARASSYTPADARRVVNASAYRMWLLANAGVRFGLEEWLERAMSYAAFVLDSQQRDGSWLYAVDGKDAFIDNFHTCFVIKNLVKTARKLPDHPKSGDLLEAASRGYGFYKKCLLDDAGQPLPFAKTQRLSLVRRELYDYAEGVNLATLMKGLDPEAERIQRCLVETLIERWQLPDGHFVTRRTVLGKNRVPYHRWAQAQTFNALCRLLAEAT